MNDVINRVRWEAKKERLPLSHNMPRTYQSARSKFVESCEAIELPVINCLHPLKGPDGLTLSMDATFIGNEKAENLLILLSGTHGPELFVGAACQVHWLNTRASELPPNTAVLMVHGINPYGSAYGFRYNENGVDLNRNFLDFSRGLPSNEFYHQLHSALSYGWNKGKAWRDSTNLLEGFRKDKGDLLFMQTLMQGQYTHPNGFGYGGRQGEWSQVELLKLIKLYAAKRTKVGLIDFHSGLGPYGYGVPICMHTSRSEALKRAKEWYGYSMEALREKGDMNFDIRGDLCSGIESHLPGVEYTAVALEFGAFSEGRTLSALCSQYGLSTYEDDSVVEKMKAEILEVFAPEAADWLAMVLPRGMQVIQQALDGLSSGEKNSQ